MKGELNRLPRPEKYWSYAVLIVKSLIVIIALFFGIRECAYVNIVEWLN